MWWVISPPPCIYFSRHQESRGRGQKGERNRCICGSPGGLPSGGPRVPAPHLRPAPPSPAQPLGPAPGGGAGLQAVGTQVRTTEHTLTCTHTLTPTHSLSHHSHARTLTTRPHTHTHTHAHSLTQSRLSHTLTLMLSYTWPHTHAGGRRRRALLWAPCPQAPLTALCLWGLLGRASPESLSSPQRAGQSPGQGRLLWAGLPSCRTPAQLLLPPLPWRPTSPPGPPVLSRKPASCATGPFQTCPSVTLLPTPRALQPVPAPDPPGISGPFPSGPLPTGVTPPAAAP